VTPEVEGPVDDGLAQIFRARLHVFNVLRAARNNRKLVARSAGEEIAIVKATSAALATPQKLVRCHVRAYR